MSENCVRLLLDVVTTVAAVGTLIAAIYALTTWRQQLRGASVYQSAKQILLSLRRLERAVQNVRSPGSGAWEWPEKDRAQSFPRIKSEQARILRHVYARRWEIALSPESEALDRHCLELEVSTNTNLNSPLQKLNSEFTALALAREEWLWHLEVENEDEGKYYSAFFGRSLDGAKDTIGDQISEAIRDLRKIADGYARKF